jgi:hypothetical protein
MMKPEAQIKDHMRAACVKCHGEGIIVPWALRVDADGQHVKFGLPFPDWPDMTTGEHFLCLCCTTASCPHGE